MPALWPPYKVDNMLEAFRVFEREFKQQQNDSGMMTPKPFIWVRNDETGELVIYSAFGQYSKEILEKLGVTE